AAGHGELLAGVEYGDVIALKAGLEFLDGVEVHNHGAADAEEEFGRELGFEIGKGVAEDVVAGPGAKDDVVGGGFEPLDVFDFDKDGAVVGLDGDAVEIGRSGGGGLEPFGELAVDAGGI